MEYYTITDKELISDIIWWVNDAEDYDTPGDFLEDVLSMCQKNECTFDSITMASISAEINEPDNYHEKS